MLFTKSCKAIGCGLLMLVIGCSATQAMGNDLQILAFGDSITQGFARDARGNCWGIERPPRGQRITTWGYGIHLERLIKHRMNVNTFVYNWGYGGLTTDRALICGHDLDCIDVVLASRNADMIMIMLGANDLYAGISNTATRHNLSVMLDKSLAQGIQPVLGTITPNTRIFGYNDRIHYHYNPLIRELARNKRVLLADHYAAMIHHWDRFYTSGDGLHLNDVGNQKLAETWYNAVTNAVQGLRVMIQPVQARNAGARWRKAGTQAWRPHGYTERLAPGTHVIEFRGLNGWVTPPNRQLAVRHAQTVTIHALYTIPQGLRVMIQPAQVRGAGAAWRRVGTQPWRPNGFMERLAHGSHVVQFRPVTGWRTPPNRQVVVRQNQLMTIAAQYSRVQ